jgi:hypothetical protein
MNVTCEQCDTAYDDARRWTICPHEELLPTPLMDRKIAALELLGKRVRFAHQRPSDAPEGYRVQSVNWSGLVSIEGFSGLFAPHLFVVVE